MHLLISICLILFVEWANYINSHARTEADILNTLTLQRTALHEQITDVVNQMERLRLRFDELAVQIRGTDIAYNYFAHIPNVPSIWAICSKKRG